MLFFRFPIVNLPWLSGNVPRLPSYDIYISQLIRFARRCTSVLDFHYKNLKSPLNFCHRVTDIKSFGKHLENFSDHTFIKLWFYTFSRIINKSNLPLSFIYKQRRVRDSTNFIASGTKIVKRLWHRQYDPGIIKNTISLVLGPSTAMYRLFL